MAERTFDVIYPFPHSPNEKNMLRMQCVPNEYLLNGNLYFSRCLLHPVSVGLIINGTAFQNVSPSLGYKFSSLQTL